METIATKEVRGEEIKGREVMHDLIIRNQMVIEDYLDAVMTEDSSLANNRRWVGGGVYCTLKDRKTGIAVLLKVFKDRLRSKDVDRLLSLSSTFRGRKICILCWRIRPEDKDLLSSRGIRVIMLDDILPHLCLDFMKAPIRDYFRKMLREEKRPSYLGACLAPTLIDTPKEMIRKALYERVEDGEIEIVEEIGGGMAVEGGNTFFDVRRRPGYPVS